MNTQIEGRYLFAGARSDSPVVGDIVNVSNFVSGVATDNYYKGDNVDLKIKASDELEVDYGIRGNDSAFVKLIGALHKSIEAETAGGDDELAEAINLVTESIDRLAVLQNEIGNNMKLLESANSLHGNSSTYFRQVKADISGTDIAEASIKVSLDETVLQATFQTFAKLSSLRLIEFLR